MEMPLPPGEVPANIPVEVAASSFHQVPNTQAKPLTDDSNPLAIGSPPGVQPSS